MAPKSKESYAGAIARAKGAHEPIVTEQLYQLELVKALNYYSIYEDPKKKRKWVMDYVGKSNWKEIDNASDYELRSISAIIRLIERNQYIAEKEKKFLEENINCLISKYKRTSEIVQMPVSKEPQKDTTKTHIAEIDNEIDGFVKNKNSNFSLKNYLRSNNIGPVISKKISENYLGLVSELKTALSGEDKQLSEGYGNFKRTELKKYLSFVECLVADCEQHVVSSKAIRLPRKRKEKSPAILVSKLKYCLQHESLKLRSVDPKTIIGSSEVWLYNTKTRKISVYKTINNDTLTVKGTSILNYSISVSNSKTIRNPEAFFSGDLSKKTLNSSFKELSTKQSTPNGRVNEDCIILGAWK